MDWSDFFERTRVAAGVESFSKLAPMLGITDGAIGHYRQGRRVPQVWVVADALRIQGHPTPEKAAIEIMKKAALTSPERTFWKKLAATATLLAVGVIGTAPGIAHAATTAFEAAPTVHYAKCNGWHECATSHESCATGCTTACTVPSPPPKASRLVAHGSDSNQLPPAVLASRSGLPQPVCRTGPGPAHAESCAAPRAVGRLASRRPRPGVARRHPHVSDSAPRACLAARRRDPLGPHPSAERERQSGSSWDGDRNPDAGSRLACRTLRQSRGVKHVTVGGLPPTPPAISFSLLSNVEFVHERLN